MFLGLPDPHSDPLVTSTDLAKIVRKTLISTVFQLLYVLLSFKNDVNVPVFRIRIHRIRTVCFWTASGSINQWCGSEDSDPGPKCHGSPTLLRTEFTENF
jgi:hypothetical protein